MCTNQKELRKEAYRLWGLGGCKIIYDFPKRTSHTGGEFYFKFDYSSAHVSWPRSYALAVTYQQPDMRVIAPIIQINQYKDFQIENRAWFDMSNHTHEQIIRLTGSEEVRRPLFRYQRWSNKILPKKYQYSNIVPMEGYVFGVIRHNGESVVRVM